MCHWYEYDIGRSSVSLIQEIMRSLFSGFAIYLRARARARLTSADHQTTNAILRNWTERASHPRRSITHRLHEQTTERDVRIESDTYRISDPYRFPIVLSSNLEYIRSSDGNDDDDDDPTGMQMRVTRALAGGNCNCSSKKRRGTRLLKNIK